MQVLACALLYDLGAADDGIRCGELAAFCVAPGFRGSGRGDSLLDYVEQVCHPALDISICCSFTCPHQASAPPAQCWAGLSCWLPCREAVTRQGGGCRTPCRLPHQIRCCQQ